MNAKKWIADNIVILIILLISSILSLYTLHTSYSYFTRNELLWNISDKYLTSPQGSIYAKNDTILINSNPTKLPISRMIIEKLDSTYVININTSVPSKYEVIKSEKESFDLGDVGDFIGGYFGFLIGIIGALLTFLAFYVQYKANRDVQKQFRLQQFESQLYKMIDVYLNNKDKFSIPGYKNPQNEAIDLNEIVGEDLLSKLKIVKNKKHNRNKNLHNLSLISFNNNYVFNEGVENKFIEYHTRDHLVYQKFLVELKVINRVFIESYKTCEKIEERELSEPDKQKLFENSYKVFFDGLNKFSKENCNQNESYVKYAVDCMKTIRKLHKTNGTKIFKNYYKDANGNDKNLWLKLNYEPFKGYLHFLPQYFRGLYSIVNFVVNQNEDLNLSPDQKKIYLRTLRSTMSAYEQTLLFYNWHGKFGSSWENENNKFFTEYKMIHNLRKITLIDDDIDMKNILSIDDEMLGYVFDNF